MDDVTSRLEERLAAVEGGVVELRAQLSATRVEMNDRFAEVPTRAEMNARFDEVPTRVEMNARFDEVPTRVEMNDRFAEMRRHFEVLHEDQRGTTRLVAEGLGALGERMERGFAEVREMFASQQRLWEAAFQNHERRLRRLEERG